ncbi:MAG: MATE family efflux transporter [Treponema sp.]|jgi:putative MATE family efflux protein|nr:MATE family efflux transporter [Treponema sp.]
MATIGNNLSEGRVLTKLIRFALPFLATNLVQSFYNVADMLIVGNFSGTFGMSGVNIGGQVTMILTFLVIGLAMGATVLIGQYVGAGNREGLQKVTATLITLLLLMALGLTLLMLILKGPILRLIKTPAESYGESDRYLTITVSGLVFIFGYNAFSAILRGMGDSKHPFYFVLIACITNVILDLLFVAVFQWSAFGAALATVISQALSMFLCIGYMLRNDFQFDFKRASFKIDKDQLLRIFKIGLPTCIQNGVTSISFLFITGIVNIVGGVSASAAVGAVSKFNSFGIMPTQAMSASISTMSAQNIGANRMDRAIEACRIGIAVSAGVTVIIFALVRIFPAQIMMIFGDDPEMIQMGVSFLRAFSVEFLIIPFFFCINGFLIGGGHTLFTLITSIVSSVVLRVPVCYIFGVVLGRGIFGVGLGYPAAVGGASLLTIGFLLSGRWKHNAIKTKH